jgi:hypothetical protein
MYQAEGQPDREAARRHPTRRSHCHLSHITSVPGPSSKQSESRTIATRDGDKLYSIKIKLIGFDGHQYLATETEKPDYF